MFDESGRKWASDSDFYIARKIALDLAAENAALKAEVDTLTKSGICEVAARNPSVMEYMAHWENRAEKAEAEVARLREALDAMTDIAKRQADMFVEVFETILLPDLAHMKDDPRYVQALDILAAMKGGQTDD
jgi:hypothetical protein